MTIDRRSVLKHAGLLPLIGVVPRLASAAEEVAAQKADYTMRIGTGLIELAPDHIVSTTLYNGRFPGPLLVFKEGQRVVVDIHNDTDTPELVHWHGPQQRSGKLAVIEGGRDDVIRRQLDQPCADAQRIVCLLRSDFFGSRCEARHHADQRKQSGICETGASIDGHASPSTRVRSSEVERTRDPRLGISGLARSRARRRPASRFASCSASCATRPMPLMPTRMVQLPVLRASVPTRPRPISSRRAFSAIRSSVAKGKLMKIMIRRWRLA